MARGLGRLSDVLSQALFPVPQELGIDSRTQKALQKQALMQLGLGMMGARDQGAGLGSGLNIAYQQAQQGLGQGVNQSFAANRSQREDRRADLQEQRYDTQFEQAAADRTRAQAQWQAQFNAGRSDQAAMQASRATDDARQQQQFEALQADRASDRNLAERRLTEQQNREEATKDKNDKRFVSSVRKEFRSLPSVKDYETVLPIYQSAKKTQNNGYGDLDMIYSVGKILDPGSVVREGELHLTIAAGSPLQKILGTTNFVLEKGGRLNPVMRKQILDMLENRVDQYRMPYEKDRAAYERYSVENEVDPFSVIGNHALSAFGPQTSGAAPTAKAAGELENLMNSYGRRP